MKAVIEVDLDGPAFAEDPGLILKRVVIAALEQHLRGQDDFVIETPKGEPCGRLRLVSEDGATFTRAAACVRAEAPAKRAVVDPLKGLSKYLRARGPRHVFLPGAARCRSCGIGRGTKTTHCRSAE